MRVISQNGAIDVPYEMIALHTKDGIIRMNMVGDTGKGSVIAQYSTEEKAENAMEMLHKEWTDFSESGLFQFPTDDEVLE